jgi:hypothetical protein
MFPLRAGRRSCSWSCGPVQALVSSLPPRALFSGEISAWMLGLRTAQEHYRRLERLGAQPPDVARRLRKLMLCVTELAQAGG